MARFSLPNCKNSTFHNFSMAIYRYPTTTRFNSNSTTSDWQPDMAIHRHTHACQIQTQHKTFSRQKMTTTCREQSIEVNVTNFSYFSVLQSLEWWKSRRAIRQLAERNPNNDEQFLFDRSNSEHFATLSWDFSVALGRPSAAFAPTSSSASVHQVACIYLETSVRDWRERLRISWTLYDQETLAQEPVETGCRRLHDCSIESLRGQIATQICSAYASTVLGRWDCTCDGKGSPRGDLGRGE